MAREQTDVTTILVNNDAYAILRLELQRVGTGPAAGAGPATRRMLDLSNPSINHTAIARGFGVDAVRVSTADNLVAALRRGYAEPGPHLIEATVPPLLSPAPAIELAGAHAASYPNRVKFASTRGIPARGPDAAALWWFRSGCIRRRPGSLRRW